MANYSLVIDSHFKPFSYAEMLAPVQAATQAHQELESAYSELETKANIWDKLASETSDPKAHSIYQKYADDLNKQAGELAKNGLSLSSRQALLNMKNRYTKEITPIEDAFNRRKDDIKAQKEMMQKDPYHMYDRKASTVSLDEYMDNPNLDVLSANQSKLLLREQVSKAAHNLKTVLTSVSGLRKLGLPFQYQQFVTRGYTPEQIMKEMMHDPQAAPILGKIVEDVMASSGIRNWSSMNSDWANNQMYREAEQFAMQGLYDAIGGTEIKYHKDDYGMQLDLMRKKYALENPPQIPQHDTINPMPVFNPQERGAENEKIQKFAKYFDRLPDGSYKPNAAGRKALGFTHRPETEWYGDGKTRTVTKHIPVDREFHEFMKGLNGGNYVTSYNEKTGKTKFNSTLGPGQVGNLYARHIQANLPTSYDAHQSTMLPVQIDTSRQEAFTQGVTPWLPKDSSGNPYMEIVEFNSKEGKYKPTKEKLTNLSDLKITHVVPVSTKTGEDLLFFVQDNNRKTYMVKGTVNPTQEKSIIGRMKDLKRYSYVLNKGKQPVYYAGQTVIDKNTNLPVIDNNVSIDPNLSIIMSDDLLKANDDIKSAVSQMVTTMKTPEDTYSSLSPTIPTYQTTLVGQ